jgi:hypothetical protein
MGTGLLAQECAVMAAKKTRIVYRDAVDGEFIKKKEAERRPRETIKEHVPLPKKPGKKK